MPKNRGGNNGAPPARGGRGRGASRGRGNGAYRPSDEIDFVLQVWPENQEPTNLRGSRGRGAKSNAPNFGNNSRGSSGFNTPRGRGGPRGRARGFDSPRGRGSGRGRDWNVPGGAQQPLSYSANPYLRPITFVKAGVLFQKEEDKDEIFKAGVHQEQDGVDESHVPTANRVAELFAANTQADEDNEDDNEEGLDVIDFEDMMDLETKVTTTGSSLDFAPNPFLGGFTSAENNTASNNMNTTEQSTSLPTEVETHPLFVVDVNPTPLPDPPPPPSLDSDDDDEVIVYEAPNPKSPRDASASPIDAGLHINSVLTGLRLGATESSSSNNEESEATPMPETASQPEPASKPDEEMEGIIPGGDSIHVEVKSETTTTIIDAPVISSVATETEVMVDVKEGPSSSPPSQDALPTAFPSFATPSRRAAAVNPRHQFTASGRTKAKIMTRRKERKVQRKKLSSFASRAMDLQDEQWETMPDPLYSERRRGDSDVDWGSDEGEEAGPATAEGMDVDPELLGDVDAMKSFVQSMGAGFTTMDDIEDQLRMQEEDGFSQNGSSSSDEDEEGTAVVHLEEELELGERIEVDLSGSDDDEDEDFGNFDTSFQGRLERLRKQSQREGKSPGKGKMLDSDDEDDLLDNNIMSLIEDNDAYFQSIVSGSFPESDDEDVMSFKPAKRRKDKAKGLPVELQDQWEKDRQKKAEKKRLRAEARFIVASDPLATHKGGKKGKKAMLAASRLDPTVHVLPNRVIDIVTLVQQIRRFLADLGGPSSMSLPPTNKATRKSVHELANAFGLNSVSKGKGDARYTTLVKTTRSGYAINETKIGKIVRQSGGRSEFVNPGSLKPGKESGKKGPRQHKDGEEVGKTAPKIGISNIGFKMLALMGWSEGDRIGVSDDGLVDPLRAVIKTTKLGLGAT